MIALSARCLAKAWLAVQLASSDDEARLALFRAVHIEEYETGVRLVSTDSYWLAHCWVPAWDELRADDDESLPGVDTVAEDDDGVVPIRVATVLDVEHRVRDLMRFLNRVTSGKDSTDQPIEVDLEATLEADDTPTLLPELERRGCRFETVSRERLIAEVFDAEWMNWRQIVAGISRSDMAVESAGLSEWMLDRFAKVCRTVGAGAFLIDWYGTSSAPAGVWKLSMARLEHAPAGVFQAVRPANPLADMSGVHITVEAV